MRLTVAFRVLPVAAVLSACGVLPTYQQPPEAPAARLNTSSAGNKWICVDSKPHRLASGPDGYAVLPAGRRVTVGSNYYNSVYGGTTTSCNPRLSFVPLAGQSYFMDFEIEDGRCNIVTYKEVKTNRIGLELDPTMEPSWECPGR
jgi:hypothetical protein